MARRRAHAPLNVFLNGRIVGVLRREATGAIDFQYATEWRDWEHSFPVSLSLPFARGPLYRDACHQRLR